MIRMRELDADVAAERKNSSFSSTALVWAPEARTETNTSGFNGWRAFSPSLRMQRLIFPCAAKLIRQLYLQTPNVIG